MTVLKKATVKSYDAASHKATVQIAGSLAVWLDDIRVATDIPAADVIAGRQCSVLFLDPSNQDEAVVITIQGANPSVPSGATVAASATVVTETAFGQASAPGSASPYSRGDHTHGTPADPVPAHAAIASVHHTSFVQADADALYETINAVTDHEALADPHTVYGALAQAEVWAALQTFNAGIQLAAGQAIKDSAGADRYTPKTIDPKNLFAGTTYMPDNLFVGPAAYIGGDIPLRAASANTVTADRILMQLIPQDAPTGTAITMRHLWVLAVINNFGGTNTVMHGLAFEPITFGGSYAELTPVRAVSGIVSGVVNTYRAFHAVRGVMAPTAGSTISIGQDIDDLGHANFPTAIGLRIANQTGSATARLIEALGLSLTNIRVDAGDPTNPGADKGRSQVQAAFNENGALSMRRHEWKDFSTLAAGDRVMVAV